MSTRSRNQYLDAETSDSDHTSSYDSAAVDEATFSRTTQRPSKRPKLHKPRSSSSSSRPRSSPSCPEPNENEPLLTTATSHHEANPPHPPSPIPPSHSTTQKPRHAANPALPKPHKPGVIYLSRIPPYMRPPTLRRLLTPHGAITRLFLTPEAPSTHHRRTAHGGNKKRSFTDGWVEFARRRDAKACADALNASTMGKGRAGGWYGEDVWNLRYLKGFAWEDLMAGVRGEEREREERVRVGVGREGRERGAFLRGVERGKVEERKREREERRGGKKMVEKMMEAGEKELGRMKGIGGNTGGGRKWETRFRQSEAKGGGKAVVEQPEDVKRVLSKIF